MEIATWTDELGAATSVRNTGNPIPPSEIDRILQPFRRIGRDRTNHTEGLGLGLSIVQAIATAHGADLSVRPGDTGGLEVSVRFPAAAPSGNAKRHEPNRLGGG